jgi:hypothetical protein
MVFKMVCCLPMVKTQNKNLSLTSLITNAKAPSTGSLRGGRVDTENIFKQRGLDIGEKLKQLMPAGGVIRNFL